MRHRGEERVPRVSEMRCAQLKENGGLKRGFEKGGRNEWEVKMRETVK